MTIYGLDDEVPYMKRFNVAYAKAHLSDLIHQVEDGEDIVITRRGHPVVRLTPAAGRPKALSSRRELRSTLPFVSEGSVVLISELRQETRY